MEDYTRYMRLLISMVQAVGRLVDAGRELSHFVGYNERVSQLYDVLNDINKGRFERTQVSQSEFKEIKGKLQVIDSKTRNSTLFHFLLKLQIPNKILISSHFLSKCPYCYT